MPTRTDQYKVEVIDRVVAYIEKRLKKSKAGDATTFARAFYRNVPADDLMGREAEDLYGAALGLWQFGETRTPGQAKVRVFNPSYETHGWHTGHTVIEIVNDDMPFLVDSISASLSRQGLSVHLIIHPIMQVVRDAEGVMCGCADAAQKAGSPAKSGGGTAKGKVHRESFMHIEVDEQSGKATLDAIATTLEAALADVRAAVEDWRAMRERLGDTIERLRQAGTKLQGVDKADVAEVVAFLEWLDDDHFTFLGCRRYSFQKKGGKTTMTVDPDYGLGVLRDPGLQLFEGLRRGFHRLSPEIQATLTAPSIMAVNKSSLLATVHRAVQMDTIILKEFDDRGKVTGEVAFVGLLTSVAYNRSARDIPYLRRKVARCLDAAGFDPRSHDGKALAHILDTYPRDELFQISDEDLLHTALGILGLAERPRTALFVRKDPIGRFVSALIYVPRDHYDTDYRLKAQRILAGAYDGEVRAFYAQLTEGVHARLHLIVKTAPGQIPEVETAELEQALIEAGRTWADHLQEALIEAKGEVAGLKLFKRFGGAFPSFYRDNTVAHAAIFDIDRIEEVISSGRLGLNLYRPIEAGDNEVRFKLYHLGNPIPLSDVLPMLEHMGLKVISENPYQVRAADSEPVWIHDFAMETREGNAVELETVRPLFQDAFGLIWDGEIEDDGFNRLVIGANLTGRQVTLLRAIAKYLRQARIQYSQDAMEDTLAHNADAAGLVVDAFASRFDPEVDENERMERQDAIGEAFERFLDGVSNLDEDRILRRFYNVVTSTLRTNYYQSQENPDEGRKSDNALPKGYISFKLASRLIDDLPLPRPWVEVFVYSPRVEGIHLRGGRVARGGIRWSDRREDFRTEILGLMKAQMVKNAVIVPVGSKGGFVVKQPPPRAAGREAAQAEGIACYRILMRGLLDITDNIVKDAIVHPPRVVRHDEDDPYLVVAADKGTATFSDIANSISRDYVFWLDDAFASGGSEGYDHKKMGITARGAWESVKRHFREMGTNTQAHEFTVAGVGDMSGDVFGNGMLLSRTIRLVAAFNHLHIFIDPNPDAAKSFEERKRLFELGRGSWDQYDGRRISKGGGVFERSAKEIKLTPEIKALLDLKVDKLTPNALISAILRAPVDLMWFGGIGTYVKATHESHGDVGDKANDSLRVNARELRAKVIGEGANLGVTQDGRIEAAKAGVRLNTDFIDNSAGVDCSDHEVNIKILLGQVVASGDLTMKQRNQLLERMTGEVAELVLRDNYLQTQALTMVLDEAPELLDQHSRLMHTLEKEGRLNREVELLPNDEELTERMGRREGLTRPELAVLLSYAKIALYDTILSSGLPDDASLAQDLTLYFPTPMREQYGAVIPSHRLHRELIATSITNSIVNRAGPTFVSETADQTGMGPADIARAYLIVRDSFDLRGLWLAIESLDNKVDATVQTTMLRYIRRLIERTTAWVLRQVGENLDVGHQVAHFRPGVEHIDKHLNEVVYDRARQVIVDRTKGLTEAGVPKDIARKVAALNLLASGLDLIHIADTVSFDVKAVAPAYFKLGDRLGIAWLRDSAKRMPSGNHWQKQATAAIIDDLYALQADLTIGALSGATKKSKVPDMMAAWMERRSAPIERIDQLMAELRALAHVDVSMLAVANRRLRGLING